MAKKTKDKKIVVPVQTTWNNAFIPTLIRKPNNP